MVIYPCGNKAERKKCSSAPRQEREGKDYYYDENEHNDKSYNDNELFFSSSRNPSLW